MRVGEVMGVPALKVTEALGPVKITLKLYCTVIDETALGTRYTEDPVVRAGPRRQLLNVKVGEVMDVAVPT